MPSPGRDQGPLDPATKVLEMESLGVKVSLLRMHVHVVSTCTMARLCVWYVMLGTVQGVEMCRLCIGAQCKALLGAEPYQHGIQLCLGGSGRSYSWQPSLALPLLHNDRRPGTWQAL